ncbi:MAG: hypothetical protein NC251_03710 [Lachnoclostridium sp.]|nr:hypothetical protein [Lachnospira sp.]MCM1247519.1 hypothetical protein [Lachnoclostridium sp.]
MNGNDVRKAVEQIQIPEKMQEEIIRNVQKQMENKDKKGRGKRWEWSLKRMAATAAALVLATGVVGVSASAVVENIVKARMDSIPKEEVQEMWDWLNQQHPAAEAETYSREYSEREEERNKELWQAYKNGLFPEKEIMLVDSAEDVIEDVLSYNKVTDTFYLPERELTDEELLEIIDLQHMKMYAFAQSPTAQEDKAKQREEQKRLREKLKALGGIEQAEALEIAENQMKAELGDAVVGMKLERISLNDEENEDGVTSGMYYFVFFRNSGQHIDYICEIDAVDGSILQK